MALHRCSSPQTVRNVWAVVSRSKDSKEDFVDVIIKNALRLFQWTPEALKAKMDGCLADGLLQEKIAANGESVYDVPELAHSPNNHVEAKHDWYCFECHRPGSVHECSKCFRVYHSECLSSSSRLISAHQPLTCNVCVSYDKARPVDDNVMSKQLEGMLMWAQNKGGPSLSALPSANANLSQTQYNLLIARHMDMPKMKFKVTNGQYRNTAQFLADFQLLVHNMFILYGKDSNIALVAQDLLKEVQAEVRIETMGLDLIPTTSEHGQHQQFLNNAAGHVSNYNANKNIINNNAPGSSNGSMNAHAIINNGNSSFLSLGGSDVIVNHGTPASPTKKAPRRPKTEPFDGSSTSAPTTSSSAGKKRKQRADNLLNTSFSTDSKDMIDSQALLSPMLDGDLHNQLVASVVNQVNDQRRSNAAAASASTSRSCNCDAKYRKIILDMHKTWSEEYAKDKEKALVEFADKLHADFEAEQEKLRKQMSLEFKQEVEATKADIDQKYTTKFQQEVDKSAQKHKADVSETKKKQWCWQCESEAIYHCCWNTSYCSVECQQQHWPLHRKYCRRKRQPQQH